MQKTCKPSICFVIPRYVTFSTGGAEIQVYYLVNEFLARGWKVELLCGGSGFEEQINKSALEDKRVKFFYYRYRTLRFLEFFEVLALLFKTRSDIYYQRTDFALTGACAMFCRLMNKKMVYALASDADALKSKYLNAFKNYSYQSIIKKNIRRVDFFLVDKLVEKGKKWSKWIICQNNLQQGLVRSNFNRDAVIIPSLFPVRKQVINDKENIVLWVGNMTSAKRPELFVRMVQNLKQTEGWRFVMIGRESDVISKGNTSKIEVKGELSYQETLAWFDRAKVFVNTSLLEGLPNTFIQAWIKQALVLSLSVDPDGLLKKETLGYVFDDDLDKLTVFVDGYLNSSCSHQHVLTKAQSYARQTYDVKKNVDKLIHLITA